MAGFSASDVTGKLSSQAVADATVYFGTRIPAKSQISGWQLSPEDRSCVLASVRKRFPSLGTFLAFAKADELPVFSPGLETVEDGRITWDEFCDKSRFRISIVVQPSQPGPDFSKDDDSLIGSLLSIEKWTDILCRCVGCLYTEPGKENKEYGSCSWCDIPDASQCPQPPQDDYWGDGNNGGGRGN